MDQWSQSVDPLNNPLLSTIAAAAPVVTLFYLLAVRRLAAWKASVSALAVAIIMALFVFRMPSVMVIGAVADGLVYAWFRVAWILIAAVFVFDVAVESGQFQILRHSIGAVSSDSRLQVLVIAFALGALLEGTGGAGAPVAVTSSILIGLGFPPFQTVLLCLVANSTPVAFAALGSPVRALVAVTGLPENDFSAMIGRILPLTALVLPFWLTRMICTTRQTLEIWPALLVCGGVFGAAQFLWSNYVGASLVDIVAGVGTLLVLTLFLRVWRPRSEWQFPGVPTTQPLSDQRYHLSFAQGAMAWTPFVLLVGLLVLWSVPAFSKIFDSFSWRPPVAGLHLRVVRVPPVVPQPHAEPALFEIAWLATPGTAAFVAGLLAGPLVGLSFRRTLGVFFTSFWKIRAGIGAILTMLAIGYVSRYAGMDATLGMALSHTGAFFPFFGTVIGWIGVALSGTDAGSNALFGGLQTITANRLGLSPILMGAANSAGGVMGKMVAAQSLVIGCASAGLAGQEGLVFRAVLKHSIALLVLVALIVTAYAYLLPNAIPNGPR